MFSALYTDAKTHIIAEIGMQHTAVPRSLATCLAVAQGHHRPCTGAQLSDLCPPGRMALEMTGTEYQCAVDNRGQESLSVTLSPQRKP